MQSASNGNLVDVVSKKTLMLMRLRLIPKAISEDDSSDRKRVQAVPMEASEASKRPVYRISPMSTDIIARELENIRSKVDAKVKLSDFEQTLYTLDNACNLDIQRHIHCTNQQYLAKFQSCITGSMMLCSTFNHFWGYQLQIATP